ncbi:hypothetical protein [Azospirillum palustre]
MTDLMLRFDTEAAAAAVLPMFRADGQWLTASHDHGLCAIGPVVTTPAVVDASGAIVTPAVMDERWHANLRLLDHPDEAAIVAACEPYAVNPPHPAVVWAGGEG